ncbi:putative T-complex protein 1 subunit gamma-like [Capsicum annuum]|uniref:Smr domain-containing protein n=1 Tax=Capsicum annuum TaxID=4072 RepID=A0A1U8GRG7_CAPAN|nr:uncharacterized protein LOC107871440 [Capsicum annuum]KAF3617086.1 putative T-complex protein 1 subunit gamma-like [Capsicum annuum]KAF3628102.1 putative T-complex protein 1 subunit gamma-like [Capsicum annuum]PHT61287.1 hypothetical protein T459_34872 [Capsicum annuum]
MAASTSVTSPLHKKMSARRAKTTGWAAFDLNERMKQQGLEPEPDRETFPHLSVPATSFSGPSQSIAKSRGAILEKPFSSLLLPSVSFPSLMTNKGSDANQIQVGDSRFNQSDDFIQERGFLEACQKLKKLHPWADDTLIADVMAGVNDFNKALRLLEAMVSPHHTDVADDNKKTKRFGIDTFLTPEEADTPYIQKFKEVDTDTKGVKSSNKDSLMNTSKFAGNKGVSLTDNVNLDGLSHALTKCLRSSSQELINNCVFHENELHYDGAVGSLRFVPVEPEWEEDDIYSIHRKDAVKTTRSAARHSKAASEAYLRGDHLFAQHFSLKAREEWIAANRLNAQAAKEILTARNGKNDQWTLDLHGLHAKEAVQALQEHLQKIESRVTQNPAAHMNQVNLKTDAGAAVSVESSGRIDVENESKGRPLNKQRPAFLEVITGKGIHSRGQAALPMAIRSFLVENGYRYEETRPGVITVRPKFRPR